VQRGLHATFHDPPRFGSVRHYSRKLLRAKVFQLTEIQIRKSQYSV
jgi:hypothetical protein